MTEPKINGTATQKIAWLDKHGPAGGLDFPNGRCVIYLGENLDNGQDINIVLSPDGGWWIE